MASTDLSFSGSIFRYDQSLVIATNRQSAKLNPVRLAYSASGYSAGQVLARNTTSGYYQAYASGGASGTGTAACILFNAHPVEDFDGTASTSTAIATGIFGGCTVFKNSLSGYTGFESAIRTDLGAREITDATGTTLLSF